MNNLLITISEPFDPWIQWSMDPVKFPINSYEIFFISMMLAVGSYIIGSLLTYKPYNLDKLLHRGEYCDGPEEALVGDVGAAGPSGYDVRASCSASRRSTRAATR